LKSLVKLRLDEITLPDWDVRAFRDPSDVDAIRKSFAESGQLEPVHVWRQNGRYVLLEGRTRYEAAKLLGLTEIEAYVVDEPLSDPYEYAFKVNALKRRPGPVSVALYMQHLLVSRGWHWGDLMRYLGVGKSTIARYMKLLDLPVEIQRKFEFGEIPLREVDWKGAESPTRGTGSGGGGGKGVRCPICGAYPSQGLMNWIPICKTHETEYSAIMNYIMRQGWREEV